MNSIPKWGFGMAPLKPKTEDENRRSLIHTRDFLLGSYSPHSNSILDDLSRVKGLFSRIVKQDQWDWFTVYMYFDYPQIQDTKHIISALSSLRSAIIKDDNSILQRSLSQLQNHRFLLYCNNYLSYDINSESASEYLYILSRREERNVLKIGMTTRNVQKRVNEINSATGVVYPLAARRVFKVKNSRLVEKEVHNMLSEYRMRADREFFLLDYVKACQMIDEYLTQNNLYSNL